MACRTSRLINLALSAAAVAAVLLVVVVLGAAATTATAAAAGSSSVPGYCVVGKAIPHSPLSGCVWYVASRSCDVVTAILPNRAVLKETCCHQLQDVPAECRCRALRVMMQTPLVVGAEPDEQRRCRAAQERFAPAVVSAAECGLRTVHGWPFCNHLDDE